MVCPKFNSDVYKLKRWAVWSTFVSVLWLGPKELLQFGKCTILQKNWSCMAPSKRKKMLWVHPMFPSSYFLFSCSTWKSFYN
jgi:hypothetical protein